MILPATQLYALEDKPEIFLLLLLLYLPSEVEIVGLEAWLTFYVCVPKSRGANFLKN